MTQPLTVCLYALGSGETSQAYAVMNEFARRGHETFLVVKKPETARYLATTRRHVTPLVAETPPAFEALIAARQPDLILLCNSKIFRHSPDVACRATSPFPKQVVATLDSNWLFLPESTSYPYVRWANGYYVNLPRVVFERGLARHGGYFPIPATIEEQIVPVGLIPSAPAASERVIRAVRTLVGLRPVEAYIFCYVSGYGAAGRPWVLENLLHALERDARLARLRVVAVGKRDSIEPVIQHRRPSPLVADQLNPDQFHALLSGAAVVVQHQGLVTLSQAISAQVPVIANVTRSSDDEYPSLHEGEVRPFAELGACRLRFRTTPSSVLANDLIELTVSRAARGEMSRQQRTLSVPGEPKLVDDLLDLISKSSKSKK